jgi:hypothetical protein
VTYRAGLPSECVHPEGPVGPAVHAMLHELCRVSGLRLNLHVRRRLHGRVFLGKRLVQSLDVFLGELDLGQSLPRLGHASSGLKRTEFQESTFA